jgi:hypothetical protein
MTEKQLNPFQIYLLKCLNLMYPDPVNIRRYKSAWLVSNLTCTEDSIIEWIVQLHEEMYIKEPYNQTPSFYNFFNELEGRTQQEYVVTQKGRDFLAMNLATDFVASSLQNSISKTTKHVTVAECALMHFYLGKFDPTKRINRTNMDAIANQYLGTAVKTSGIHLYLAYQKYSEEPERIRLNDANKRSAREHVKRFRTILPLLEMKSKHAFKLAENEYKKVKEKYEDLYPM